MKILQLIQTVKWWHIFLFVSCLLILEFVLLKELPFFWDAISKSSRANWIYESNFKQFIVPTEMNSGHPPLWISLLALSWKLLGKSLFASRILLLIVNVGVVYQILLLCKDNLISKTSILLSFLVLIEPTFIAQTTSLNNDMLLLFFTILSVNSLLNSRLFYLSLALTGLLFTNLRGIYLFIAIVLIHAILDRKNLIPKAKGFAYYYLAPVLLFAIFCVFQFNSLGWFIITKNEGYNQHRQMVGFGSILKNFFAFVKCFFDYGRVFLFLFFIPLLFKYFKNNVPRNKQIDRLVIIFLVFTMVLFIGTIPFSNPFGDRYFLISYIVAVVLTINLLIHLKTKWHKAIIYGVSVGFITGHIWIYPSTLSQSWDSSLAYLNYYKIEDEMECFIDSVNIDHKNIGTRIPLNHRSSSELKPFSANYKYADFDLRNNQYVLLSNIENNTKDDELFYVQNHWQLVKCYSQMGVFMALYKNE